MTPKQLIVEQYQEELKKGYFTEAIVTLLGGIERFDNDIDLIQLLSDLRSDYNLLKLFTEAQISKIQEFKKKATGENYTNLILFETTWWSDFGFGGRQVSWEILFEALMEDQENDALLNAIEELNDADAPTFADGMETIAREVVKGHFSRELFDYLLLVLEDPEYPDALEFAAELANRKA